MKAPQSSRVRFGSFELDLRSGELRPLAADGGRAVVLQEQPFQVLRILIERNGEVATREEIKNKLWPNDTAVDFNHSINVTIGTLRRVLRDSVEVPQYIETVGRRGYRFIAPAEWVKAPEERPDAQADRNGNSVGPPGTETVGLIGKKVSHYRVLEVIGGGGMGMVYKAEDLKLGRRVALKFLPEELAGDTQALLRFEREAQTASSVNHAHICTIHEIEEYEGQPFIAMELLEGETLRDRLAASASKALPFSELLEIAIQICDGLEAAHGNGIIHRDIKPANIFLTRQGPVKILDFGLAKLAATEEKDETDARHSGEREGSAATRQVDATLTRTGMAIGTAGYMSPEQIRKEPLDARTDLFSFGLVLYEMATGRRAFSGETAEVLQAAILSQPLPPMAVPPGMEAIVAKALEKDRRRRYQSAAEMRVDMEALRSEKRPQVRRPWKWLAATALLLAVATGGWLYWRSRKPISLTANDAVVLADIANRTSDPVFDDALNTALRVEFEQTPFLNVLATDKIRGTLKLLNHAEDAKVTPQVAREVCLRTNSRVVISSSIADEGNHFRIALEGIDCRTGKILASAQQEVADRNEIVHELGVSASQLRASLGEPEASVKQFNQPLDRATSSSPEALQLLTEGYRHHIARDDLAVSYYQRAIEMDPKFALAYLSLGARYGNVGQLELGQVTVKKAYDLRDRLTVQSGLLAETLYYSFTIGDLEKAYPAYLKWVQTFPLDVRAHINFNVCLQHMGEHDKSVAEAREAVRLLPSVTTYINLIFSTILASRVDEAKAALDQAQALGFDGVVFRDYRHRVAFMQKDQSAMRAQVAWAMGKGAAEGQLLTSQSDVEYYYGQFREGQRLLRQAAESMTRDDVAIAMEDRALEEAEVGNLVTARHAAAATVGELRKGMGLALLWARIGEIEPARRLSEKVSQEYPGDTLVQDFALPAIRAAIRLQQNDPSGAVEVLRPALKYDLASIPDFYLLYPTYLRGLAYLRLQNGPMAAVQFQRVLDHPGLVGRGVMGSLSRLQLARAQAMSGDKAAARESYRAFLDLWKNADPDIPIYKQAKTEYARILTNATV